MSELFIPMNDGVPMITGQITLAVTTEHLNNMSKTLRTAVLTYPGDVEKWKPPTTWWGRLFAGATPNHSWCPGKMEPFASSGLLVLREYRRCNTCGRVVGWLVEY